MGGYISNVGTRNFRFGPLARTSYASPALDTTNSQSERISILRARYPDFLCVPRHNPDGAFAHCPIVKALFASVLIPTLPATFIRHCRSFNGICELRRTPISGLHFSPAR